VTNGTGVGELSEGSNAPFVRSLGGGWRKDDARPLDRISVSALCSVQCFDTDGWVTGRTNSQRFSSGTCGRIMFWTQVVWIGTSQFVTRKGRLKWVGPAEC